MSGSRYYPHLDALRALAVMGPVFLHLWPAQVPNSPLTARITGIGFLGVELFFVISGFLITGILLEARAELARRAGKSGRVLAAFWARRALRIFPVYWVLLLALAAAGVAGAREHFWWEAGYLTNVLIVREGHWLGTHSHFWSLAVEEQFYVLWPLVVLFTPRGLLVPVIAAVAAGGPLFRWYALRELGLLDAVVLLPACMDVLALGALLACLRHGEDDAPGRARRFARVALITGGALSVVHLALYLRSADSWITGWPLARTGYALLFVALVDRAVRGLPGAWSRVAEWRPVVHLGTVSYAVYLFHPLVAQLPGFWRTFGGLATTAPVAWFAVQLAATVALATLSWHLLERPLNGLRRHFPYPT